MATCLPTCNFKQIDLSDIDGNIYSIAVSEKDYERILIDENFALLCLNEAKQLGFSTKNQQGNCESQSHEDCERSDSVTAVSKLPENFAANTNTSKWPKKCVLLLIELFQNYRAEFEVTRRKKDVWEKICQVFKDKGYNLSVDDCDIKWRNLKSNYKKIKDNRGKTGRGNITWEFFDAMDEILSSDHAIKPVNLLYSSKSASNLAEGAAHEFTDPISLSHSSSCSSLSSPSPATSTSNLDKEITECSSTSKIQKCKKVKTNTGTPDWFLDWTVENRKHEERFQGEILKRLDAKNATLEKMADAFFKM